MERSGVKMRVEDMERRKESSGDEWSREDGEEWRIEEH